MENNILEKIKNIPPVWAWLIVLIVGSVIAFYWFGVRPEQIRKNCYFGPSRPDAEYNCLKRNGLE